MYLSLVPCVTP